MRTIIGNLLEIFYKQVEMGNFTSFNQLKKSFVKSLKSSANF